jgi:hypothetical protein
MMAGRKTKLTPAVREKILQAIRMGNYAVVAAAAAGIGETTFYEWIARGEERIAKRPGSRLYAEFAEAVKLAEAQAEVRAVEMVNLQMADNWQAAMTYLERRHPGRWKRRDELNFRNLSDAALLARITGALGGGGSPWLEIADSSGESDALSESAGAVLPRGIGG